MDTSIEMAWLVVFMIWINKRPRCKQCKGLVENIYGNFCSKKCRNKWKRKHNYTKRDWKTIENRVHGGTPWEFSLEATNYGGCK